MDTLDILICSVLDLIYIVPQTLFLQSYVDFNIWLIAMSGISKLHLVMQLTNRD